MAKWKLIGLVEPRDESLQEAFEEWYLGSHVENVSHAPGIVRASALRLVKPFLNTDPPQFVSLYEVEAEDVDAATEALLAYEKNPTWPGAQPSNNSIRILSAGWYQEDCSFSSPD